MPQQQGQFSAKDIGQFHAEDIDQAETVAPTPPPSRPGSGVVNYVKNALNTEKDLAIGAVKGAASTAVGLGELVHKLPFVSQATDALYGMPAGSSQSSFSEARKDLTPTNTAQAFGKGAEQIGEFFLPAGATTKLKAAATTGRGLLDAMFGAAAEAGSAGAVTAAQTGSPSAAIPSGTMAGALSLAVPGAGKGLQWLGERIEKSLIKAGTTDVKHGFKIGNVFKHNLGGTLSQTYDKATAKLGELGTALKAELAKVGPGGVVPEVDVLGELAGASVELGKNIYKTTGRNAQIDAALQKILDDPAMAMLANGKADLATAQEIKQAMGELGAWAHGMRDPDSNAMEIVANAFYGQLKNAIEKAAPAGPTRIRALNQQMGEIIPIREAIIRRIPVDQRQNVLKLGDQIAMGTGAWGLALANRLLQSGRVANMAVKTGGAAANAAPSVAKVGGGLTSLGVR